MTITTNCTYCAGFGLVHGLDGDPRDCPRCFGAGCVWPPSCDRCGMFGRIGEPCKRPTCATDAEASPESV